HSTYCPFFCHRPTPHYSTVIFSFHATHHTPPLHSFPTRRSSDLSPEKFGRAPKSYSGQIRWVNPESGWPELLWPSRFWIDPSNLDRKSTRLNSSHVAISYAVFCLKKKKQTARERTARNGEAHERR